MLVESRGVDLPAVTAWEALRGTLGYAKDLERLRRADVWGVWTHASGERLQRLSELLVGETSVFVNPNKHKWRVWIGGSEDGEISCDGAWSLISAVDDAEGRSAQAALVSSGLGRSVSRVAKTTLWRFSFAPSARGRELELAKEMTVTSHRGGGLLANPHIHSWACGVGNVSLDQALLLLDQGRTEEKVQSV